MLILAFISFLIGCICVYLSYCVGKDQGYQQGFFDGINAQCNAEEILEMIEKDNE